jgi:hypothetical protein
MSKQTRKYNLSLAGEFFVAAELQRRGVMATITYGNAKRADVVAFSPCNSRAIVIEVKSSGANKWVVGNKNPDASDDLWVLVRIPEYSDESPRFFILIAQEIHNILAPGEEEYRRKYKEMNGQDYTGTGVYSLRLDQIQSHEHQWEKVLSRVEKVNI